MGKAGKSEKLDLTQVKDIRHLIPEEAIHLIEADASDDALSRHMKGTANPVTRHMARKWISMYKEWMLLQQGAMPKQLSNSFEAETREEWFYRVVAYATPKFHKNNLPMPKVRIGCGFPSSGKRGHALGECWHSSASDDDVFEIYINPRVNTSKGQGEWIKEGDPLWEKGDLLIANVVVHELCHATLFHAGHEKHGHGRLFKEAAGAMGLDVINRKGSTVWTGEGREWAKQMLEDIGPYPHAPIKTKVVKDDTQLTRLLLLVDPINPDYKIRMARGPVALYGIPFAPRPDNHERAGERMRIEPVSALKTKYTTDQMIAAGLVAKVPGTARKYELTDKGREEAAQLIEDIIHGRLEEGD